MSYAICFRCLKSITPDIVSSEHIILRSLGGRLQSDDLLCITCNGIYGETIDAELAKQIPLATLLDIKLQRGEARPVLLTDSSGESVYVDKDLQSTLAKPKIEEGKSYEFRTDKEANSNIKGIQKRYPDKVITRIDKFTVWDKPFSSKYDLIIGADAYKSIIKTAIEFFLLSGGEMKDVEYARYILNSNSKINNVVKYYYTDALSNHLGQGEISHTIVLSGCPKSKLLYCYIELFAVHCFLVILNYNYHGEPLSNTYSLDLLQTIPIQKNIILNITREDALSYKFPVDNTTEAGYFLRLKRVYDIKGIKMEVTKRRTDK